MQRFRSPLWVVFAAMLLAVLLLVVVALVYMQPAGSSPTTALQMTATAYSLEGPTKSGVPAQEGVVAADPEVLPLGTRIRVYDSDSRIGEFVVADTGRRVRGNLIDIYLPTTAAAREFGRREVKVEVLSWGEGAESARREMRTDPPAGAQ